MGHTLTRTHLSSAQCSSFICSQMRNWLLWVVNTEEIKTVSRSSRTNNLSCNYGFHLLSSSLFLISIQNGKTLWNEILTRTADDEAKISKQGHLDQKSFLHCAEAKAETPLPLWDLPFGSMFPLLTDYHGAKMSYWTAGAFLSTEG